MYPTLNPGELRHEIEIYQRGAVSIGVAGATVASELFTTAMAGIVPVKGLSVIDVGQETTQLTLGLKIWYQPGIAPDMEVRLVNGGSRYKIQSIQNVLEMNVVMILNCMGLGANA